MGCKMAKEVFGKWYWIIVGVVFGSLFTGFGIFSKGGRGALKEIFNLNMLFAVAVGTVVIIVPMFLGLWWYDKSILMRRHIVQHADKNFQKIRKLLRLQQIQAHRTDGLV